jgi:hypothetical protein
MRETKADAEGSERTARRVSRPARLGLVLFSGTCFGFLLQKGGAA